MIPGEYFLSKNPILANVGKKTIKINVTNTGDRPIQIGSHTHFFETNKAENIWFSSQYSIRNITAV